MYEVGAFDFSASEAFEDGFFELAEDFRPGGDNSFDFD